MIDPINSNYSILNDKAIKNKNISGDESFSTLLKEGIDKVNNMQVKSDKMTEKFALGEIDNIHEVTIASEKAKTALNLTLSIQNKVVDAYEEIMRMQV